MFWPLSIAALSILFSVQYYRCALWSFFKPCFIISVFYFPWARFAVQGVNTHGNKTGMVLSFLSHFLGSEVSKVTAHQRAFLTHSIVFPCGIRSLLLFFFISWGWGVGCHGGTALSILSDTTEKQRWWVVLCSVLNAVSPSLPLSSSVFWSCVWDLDLPVTLASDGAS